MGGGGEYQKYSNKKRKPLNGIISIKTLSIIKLSTE